MKSAKALFASTLLLFFCLITSCSSDDTSTNEPEEVQATIKVYENISFDVDTNGLDTDRFFSTASGIMYSYDSITAEVAPTIDLVYYDSGPSNDGFLFWDSPDDLFDNEAIEGMTATKFENTADAITAPQFDEIINGTDLDTYTIVQENEALGPREYPIVVLFENAAGKKGAIKMKSRTADVLVVDIKVQL